MKFDDLKIKMENEREAQETNALVYMNANSLSIEVIREDNQLERIIFARQPYGAFRTTFVKDYFNLHVNRESGKAKGNSIMDLYETLRTLIDIEIKINSYFVKL